MRILLVLGLFLFAPILKADQSSFSEFDPPIGVQAAADELPAPETVQSIDFQSLPGPKMTSDPLSNYLETMKSSSDEESIPEKAKPRVASLNHKKKTTKKNVIAGHKSSTRKMVSLSKKSKKQVRYIASRDDQG